MDEVQVIIFSKNRSLQLEACLHSFYDNCVEKVDINVLYTTTNDDHENSYKKLQKTYKNVVFLQEKSFKSDLLGILTDKTYVLFVCDDAIFTDSFSLQKTIDFLKRHSKTIGFSFRLGTNTQYCYSHNMPQDLPEYTLYDNIMLFDWTTAQLDFQYPVELSSSIYKIDDILPILDQCEYKNPNDLEWVFYINLNYFANLKQLLGCFEISVAFCNPINKVQNVNNNRSGENYEFNSENLLKIFNKGYRIDLSNFKGFVSSACHQEVHFSLRRDDEL